MGLSIPVREDSATLIADQAPVTRKRELVEDRPAVAKQTILVVGLSSILMFAVLAFGCTDPWSITGVEVGAALLLLLWIWPQISWGSLEIKESSLWAPVILFALLVVAQVVFGLSAYGHMTRTELWTYAAYGSLFLVATQLQRIGAQRFLTVLAVFGFVVALFALVQDLTYNGKIYWFWPSVTPAFGPYANYSHYAGLMEMLTPIALAMALDGTKRHQQLLWMVAGILMAATIFISSSRGGMIAFVVEIVFLAGFLIVRRGRRTAWILFALCLLIGALALWIDDGRMLTKVDSLREPLTKTTAVTRLIITRDSLKMVPAHPIVGWGLGVFPIVYPQYRSFSTDLIINEAHNDYTQVLVETGILGFACVVWFIVNLYRSGIENLATRSRVATARTLGPLVGCTGLLVHSLSDFNLHIPANAALFFVLSGIASERPSLNSRDQDTRNGVQGIEHDLAVASVP